MTRKLLALGTTVALILALLMIGPAVSNSLQQEQQPKAKKKKAAGTAKKAVEVPERPSAGVKNAPPVAEFVNSLIEAAREGGASLLSNGDSYDDFASVAQTSDGTVYMAYAAYYNGHDQVRLHRQLGDGWWSTRTHMPLARARADIWMPQLAVDAEDRVWVIWSEQIDQQPTRTGNWELFARPLIGDRWGDIVRLTNDPKPDINPHVVTDAKHNIHVVWQAHPQNSGDIQYCRFDGKGWSKPLGVTSDPESDWFPHAAVDKHGTVWIAFDSYRRGDYDVFLTSVKDNQLGQVVPIATSDYYEAHPSVACGDDGRVWVAWEEGGFNWGKDQGYWLKREDRLQGTTLGSTRAVKVACWHDGKLLAAPEVASSLPQGERRQSSAFAELASGSDGRLWLRFRHLIRGREQPNRNTFQKGWAEYVTHLTGDGWAEAQMLPASPGRISVFSRILPVNDGSLLVAYSGDARAIENYHRPIKDQVLFKKIAKPDAEPKLPELAEYQPPEPPAGMQPWNKGREEQQVAAIRGYRTNIAGRPHHIVRGDLHRHTEMSWDVGPGNDGSYLDFYRYMIDVAAMDFGSLTDHQGGGHYPYWWWLTEKSVDMYHLAPRFVPLYGYERSVSFPNGHRNVFHAYRGVPVFPFQLKLDQSGVFPGVGTGAVLDNDTKLLYAYLHGTGGLAISHTSATSSMGTDWRDNDPVIEPVVEIYQGARYSSEVIDGVRVYPSNEDPAKAPGGYQEAGMLWNAYKKGYRLGTTSSSDHGSTHISYSLVYTPENDRQAILDSIRRRHTYGATDNLIVQFEANGRFMGEEFNTSERPNLRLRAIGTSRITKLDLVRNNEYIFTGEPKLAEIDFKYTDMQPADGLNLYYFRMVQEDGEVAWSSPVWVHYKR